MKLTEAKLKQMILEALKKSSFRSFGVPTPDEKLKADYGDEIYGKIQSLDKNQADVMKQSLDSNYPWTIEQESLYEILESAGFKLYNVGDYTKAPTMHHNYSSRTWFKGRPFSTGSIQLQVEYAIYESESGTKMIRYNVIHQKKTRYGNTWNLAARDKIKIPSMFELSLKTKEGLNQADAILLSREKQSIEEALEQYK